MSSLTLYRFRAIAHGDLLRVVADVAEYQRSVLRPFRNGNRICAFRIGRDADRRSLHGTVA